MNNTCTVREHEYPIVGWIKGNEIEKYIPVLDVPQMSDYAWQKSCLEARLAHPERYAGREDVEAVIGRLRKWLRRMNPGNELQWET